MILSARQLLELAAEAVGLAGFILGWESKKGAGFLMRRAGRKFKWNPLEDNEQALQLLVQLRLPLNFGSAPYSAVEIDSQGPGASGLLRAREALAPDDMAATRVAIVRAAAARALATTLKGHALKPEDVLTAAIADTDESARFARQLSAIDRIGE